MSKIMYKRTKTTNNAITSLFVNPHAQDQSNKELAKIYNLFPILSTSSNVCLLCTVLMIHIKHREAMFQITDKFLLNQT